jgi:flagellar motor switch/type III secretory pathway protein FliN
MHVSFTSWLPEGALTGGAVERALESIAAAWSETWLARELIQLLPASLRQTPAEADGMVPWKDHSDGLSLSLAQNGRNSLAVLMLGLHSNDLPSQVDRLVMDRLADRALDDLGIRLAAAFGFGAEWAGSIATGPRDLQPIHYRFGTTAGAPLITLAIEAPAAVSLIKARMPSPRDTTLGSLSAGLEQQEVSISGRLGGCTISLAELSALVSGDVIVLDRATSDPIELAVAGKAGEGRCTIEQSETGLQLKIVKAISG